MHSMRTLLRIAQRLQEARPRRVRTSDDSGSAWRTVTETWARLQSMHRRLQIAEGRGFVHCLASLREDFHWELNELARTLTPFQTRREWPGRAPGLGDWVHELRALEAEFGGFEFVESQSVLRVTTEPITLQDVDLGPFAIEWVWTRIDRFRGPSCFDVVALDPNPATGRNEVPHPHVNDGGLCAGDAVVSIERALDDGRLCDAFVLIRSVLTTYNARSAYVPLSEWDGLTCGECGDRTDRGSSQYCPGCESDLCESCSSCCRSCEETRCGGCLTECEICRDSCCSGCRERVASGEDVCPSCRETCNGCHTVLRRSELDDAGRCESCAEAADTSDTPSSPLLETTHAS